MGLFGKKKEGKKNQNPGLKPKNRGQIPDLNEELPSLPELPNLSNFDFPRSKMHMNPSQSLPSFPNSDIGNKLNQHIIKSAVSDNSVPNIPELPNEYEEDNEDYEEGSNLPTLPEGEPEEVRQAFRERYSSEFPAKEDNRRSLEISDWSKTRGKIMPGYASNTYREPEKTKKAEPVFVRMDKFESVVSTLNEIIKKVSEIENTLKNIKEIKTKENEEIIEWERELELLKSKIDHIDREVFSKI